MPHLHASYAVNEDEGTVEYKIEGLSSEDFATILGGFRKTRDEYSRYYANEYVTGRADQVAGRTDEAEIRAYLEYLELVIYRLERIYDLSGQAHDYLSV